MKTRNEIYSRLNNYLSNNLADKLQTPLLKKAKFFLRNGITVRVGKDDTHLDKWWRHPMFVSVTPQKDHNLVQFKIKICRWHKDAEKYATEHSDLIKQTEKKVQELTSKYFNIEKETVAKTDTKIKYTLTITVQVKFEGEIVDRNNQTFAKITDYLAELSQITLELSEGLPVGEKEEYVDEEEEDVNREDFQNTVEFTADILVEEEYGSSYGTFTMCAEVNKEILIEFRNSINYKTLSSLINNVLTNNINTVIVEAHDQCNLSEFLQSDFDWFSLSPRVEITEIDGIDISPIYRNEGVLAAKLLDVEEDDVEDWVCDFVNDIRFCFDENEFKGLIQE